MCLKSMFKARCIHAKVLKNGLQNHVYKCNLLLQSYVKSGSLSDAQKLLHRMPHRNVVSYNTLLSGYFKYHQVDEALQLFALTPDPDCRSWNIAISGCVSNQRPREAMTLFLQMRHSSVTPDDFTYAIVIPFCDLGIGQQVHAEIMKVCSTTDAWLGTNVMRMYAEEGYLGHAIKMFDDMPDRDMVTWNALISFCSNHGMGKISIELFRRLIKESIRPDDYTYAIVLNEFASQLLVFEAMQVHSLIVRSGFCSDLFISNSLLNLYSRCGFTAHSAKLFEEMPEQDVVSWTAVIGGYVQSRQLENAVWCFNQMLSAGIEPNSFTFGSLLGACADACAFEKGKQLHGLVLKFQQESDVVVASAVVNMYSKCGEMNDALKVFQRMPEKDIISWNGVICGFAQNGKGMKALDLFKQMLQSGPTIVVPNHVTFVGVLSACSHCGLVKEGLFYFSDMIHKHLIKPKAEHYTCMIDMLARAGFLEEAEALILSLPFKGDNVMWGTLLGACRLHGNLNMARRVSECFHVDDPDESSNHVLLANTYIETGERDKALEVREVMDARGTQKSTGCSWIEIRNCVHSFVSGDKKNTQIDLIFEVLQRLCSQMMESDDAKLHFFWT